MKAEVKAARDEAATCGSMAVLEGGAGGGAWGSGSRAWVLGSRV